MICDSSGIVCAGRSRTKARNCALLRNMVFVSSEALASVIPAARRQAFAAEGLTDRRDDGDKAASDFDFVTEYYMSFQNDEDSVRYRAALIELKTGWPD